VHFVRTIAGAEGTRLSLRPLNFVGADEDANPRARGAAGGLLLFDIKGSAVDSMGR
jgi:hypothetical protein